MEKQLVEKFQNELVVLYIKSSNFATEKYYLRIISCSEEGILCLDAKGRMQMFSYEMIQGCSEMTPTQKEKFSYVQGGH